MKSEQRDRVLSSREKKMFITEMLYDFDLKLYSNGTVRIIGIDEAGRGPLAGPVVAAAVCLDLHKPITGINDSKKCSEKERETLYQQITEEATGWAVACVSHEEIDTHNILNATFHAMNRAVMQLSCIPWDIALVDGNRGIPDLPMHRQKTIVSGDARSASIAAASIIAKVTRDRIMKEYHHQFPEYGFDRHKGYGTRFHLDCIRRLGLSDIHRKSFCQHLFLQTELFPT